jgi:hypothetical protein
MWIVLALICWTLQGAGGGLVLGLLGPVGRSILRPMQHGLGWLCQVCGLRGAAAYFAAV